MWNIYSDFESPNVNIYYLWRGHSLLSQTALNMQLTNRGRREMADILKAIYSNAYF